MSHFSTRETSCLSPLALCEAMRALLRLRAEPDYFRTTTQWFLPASHDPSHDPLPCKDPPDDTALPLEDWLQKVDEVLTDCGQWLASLEEPPQ